ncbi:MAG: hypothetical protein GF346_10280 [Candidatus Eisenbacteria bacterium]|nr:hypothetical protein [Candidatus Latescibacterota bacterium]MBD3302822.1 hypothetical protein [Candidatus Eisenbacteria bacterium]
MRRPRRPPGRSRHRCHRNGRRRETMQTFPNRRSGPFRGPFVLLVLIATSWALPCAALEITETSPVRYALSVPSSLDRIETTFDAPLAPVEDGMVRVAGTMSGLHEGSLETDGATLVFHDASTGFQPGELVVVNLRSDIASTGDETLVGGRMFAFTIAAGSGSWSWTEPETYGASEIPYFIHGGDLDGDGTPDLAVPNEGTDDVSIFRNADGDGTFDGRAEYGVGEVPSSIFGEDLDNDGDQDLATADIISGTMTVLLNDGDGTFGAGVSYPAGIRCRQIHGGDFDGDNDVDLCTTSNGTDEVYIWWNDGAAGFADPTILSDVPDGPFAIRTGDFDLDGLLDVGVACREAGDLRILRNDGAGGFVSGGTFPIGSGPWCLNGNDLDGDGDFDLVSVASYEDRFVVLWNDGTGQFSTTDRYVTGDYPLGVFAADLDGDGDIDATSSNYSGASVDLFANDGAGGFSLQNTLAVSLAGSYTWAHDLDGDGDLDLSIVDENADLLFVFFQEGAPAAVPDGPIARGSARPSIEILPNPMRSGGIATVRIGGAPDAEAILDLIAVDGTRISRLWSGSTNPDGASLDWEIPDLPAGRYYLRLATRSGATARAVEILR